MEASWIREERGSFEFAEWQREQRDEGCETNRAERICQSCYSWFLECVGKAECLHSWPALFTSGCPAEPFTGNTHRWHAHPETVPALGGFCQKEGCRLVFVAVVASLKTPASGQCAG